MLFMACSWLHRTLCGACRMGLETENVAVIDLRKLGWRIPGGISDIEDDAEETMTKNLDADDREHRRAATKRHCFAIRGQMMPMAFQFAWNRVPSPALPLKRNANRTSQAPADTRGRCALLEVTSGRHRTLPKEEASFHWLAGGIVLDSLSESQRAHGFHG
jgi:hypothetical protein